MLLRFLRPTFLPLLVLLGACGNDGVWLQTWWGPLDAGEGESPFPPGGAIQVQGFAHRVQTDPAITGAASRDLVGAVLVAAEQPVSCDAYARFLSEVADVQLWVDDVLAAAPEDRPTAWVPYVCQELAGTARDAFGGEGVYRAVHAILDVTGSAAPADGVFAGAVPGVESTGFDGGELLTGGSFVARVYERAQHGEGILPESGGGGTAPWQDPTLDIDPAELCASLLGALLDDIERDRDTYPDRASLALQATSHRYYHHYKTQETITIKGAEQPLGVVLPEWSVAADQGADLALTLFGQVSRAPEIFPYQQLLISTQGQTVRLVPCERLNATAGLVWPEIGGLPGAPAGSAPAPGDDDDSAGDDDDSALP